MGFPRKNTGMSCHFLLQGIFPIQGLNLSLLHLFALPMVNALPLSHLGSPEELRNVLKVELGECEEGVAQEKRKPVFASWRFMLELSVGIVTTNRVFRLLLQRFQRFKRSQQKSKWKLLQISRKGETQSYLDFLLFFFYFFIILCFKLFYSFIKKIMLFSCTVTCRILVLWCRELCPLLWKVRVLTTGLPENSCMLIFHMTPMHGIRIRGRRLITRLLC